MNKKIKRNIDDSVFLSLFSETKYLKKLYKELLKKDVNEEDIKLLDTDKVFIYDLYHDLSFSVKDEIIVLIEAQSRYSKNIATRLLFYAAKNIEEYIRNKSENKTLASLYGTKDIMIPSIKLFTVYTGPDKIEDHYIKLSELMVDNKLQSDINLKVKVLCLPDEDIDNGEEHILDEYMMFCKIHRQQKKKYGDKEIAIKEAIKICTKKGILRDFLMERKHEVIDMMAHLVTTEEWLELEKIKSEKKGIKKGKIEGIKIGEQKGKIEGIKIGEQKGKVELLMSMGKTNDEILEILNISKKELEKIKKEIIN